MSSDVGEFRESAQHPRKEHFEALCYATEPHVSGVGCERCQEPSGGAGEGKDEREPGWRPGLPYLKTGIQLNKAPCLQAGRG